MTLWLQQKHTLTCLQDETKALLKLNTYTASFELSLTPDDALMILEAQAYSLEASGRIAFGQSLPEAVIMAFCDSPFIHQSHYVETIEALIDLFYTYQSEMCSMLSDDELLNFMKTAFNERCNGSLILLGERELPRLSQHLKTRKR